MCSSDLQPRRAARVRPESAKRADPIVTAGAGAPAESARSAPDVSEFVKGVQTAKEDMGDMPYIAIGMSKSGRKTRRLDCEIGNFMTYASSFGDGSDDT